MKWVFLRETLKVDIWKSTTCQSGIARKTDFWGSGSGIWGELGAWIDFCSLAQQVNKIMEIVRFSLCCLNMYYWYDDPSQRLSQNVPFCVQCTPCGRCFPEDLVNDFIFSTIVFSRTWALLLITVYDSYASARLLLAFFIMPLSVPFSFFFPLWCSPSAPGMERLSPATLIAAVMACLCCGVTLKCWDLSNPNKSNTFRGSHYNGVTGLVLYLFNGMYSSVFQWFGLCLVILP